MRDTDKQTIFVKRSSTSDVVGNCALTMEFYTYGQWVTFLGEGYRTIRIYTKLKSNQLCKFTVNLLDCTTVNRFIKDTAKGLLRKRENVERTIVKQHTSLEDSYINVNSNDNSHLTYLVRNFVNLFNLKVVSDTIAKLCVSSYGASAVVDTY